MIIACVKNCLHGITSEIPKSNSSLSLRIPTPTNQFISVISIFTMTKCTRIILESSFSFAVSSNWKTFLCFPSSVWLESMTASYYIWGFVRSGCFPRALQWLPMWSPYQESLLAPVKLLPEIFPPLCTSASIRIKINSTGRFT
jgi:hypothetical protein